MKHCACKVSIKCEDALQLESIKDNEISMILTDPPWGYYEDISNIEEFYNAMFKSFKRILKTEGRAVVLSARKKEIVAAVKNEKGYITKHIDTLVNGKKRVFIWFGLINMMLYHFSWHLMLLDLRYILRGLRRQLKWHQNNGHTTWNIKSRP